MVTKYKITYTKKGKRKIETLDIVADETLLNAPKKATLKIATKRVAKAKVAVIAEEAAEEVVVEVEMVTVVKKPRATTRKSIAIVSG